jgi:hypothetical protein
MRRALLVSLAVVLLSACGGAARPAEAPLPAEPTTIEEAQAQIAAARRDLGLATGASASSFADAPATPPAQSPPPPPPPQVDAKPATPATEREESETKRENALL